MSRPSRLDYAYAVGRVRALERYLIPEAVFREAAETGEFQSALKIAYDAGRYPEDLIKAEKPEDLDALLLREEEKLKREIKEILLDKDILEAALLEESPGEALTSARKAGNAFVVDYFRQSIDLGNIKVFFRAKYLGFPADRLERLFLPGGAISPRVLLESYRLPWTEAADRFRSTAYGDLWIRAVEGLEERETFIDLEKRSEDLVMAYLRRAKQITFGPEPVFAYGLARKKELRLVRLLGLGKMLRVPVEILKERISATYV
ncbi:MAG: hypothetical protein FJY81_00950 [Candidatus Aminicenantes bacterium]|nr:hypothetical protein [Candidatus Aminicenantes bacterium]